MTTGLAALDSLGDLTSLDKAGKPPKPSRLPSAAALRELDQRLTYEDQGSAITRTRIQAVKDGEAPYNQAALIANGQGSRANFNSLMMEDLLSKCRDGYNDVFLTPKDLVKTVVDYGEESERYNKQRIISTELTRTIRKWRSFEPNAKQLVDIFTTHGVGIGYFPDTKDFRFEIAGFGEFHIPRGTKASEEKIPYAIARKDMQVTELYEAIENEEAAKKMGWNIDAVRLAIANETNKSSNGEIGAVEKYQQQVKNNDLHSARMYGHVPCLVGYVREFDGTISFFITEKDNPSGEFLFKEYSRYKTVDQAFTFFCYGVGNGTYHSIRGLGHMLFALSQLHSRLMCQKADGVMLDESVMVQATSGNALQNAAIHYLGPMALLGEGFDIVEKNFSSSERTLPFLGEVKNLMGQNSSRYMTPSSTGGEAYQNKDRVGLDLETQASVGAGSLDLFYGAWDRLMREVCRRIIVSKDRTDPLIAEFHRRVTRAGITQQDLDNVDHDSTYAFRTFGAGNPASRALAYKNLMEMYPQYDEIGRKRILYQRTADLVGYQNADYFTSDAEEPRLGPEAGQAELENGQLMQGIQVKVFAYQMHATHLQIHLPQLLEILDAVERGEMDPVENLPGLKSSLIHISEHGEAIASDPTQEALYNQVKEAVNNLNQVITNMERKLKAAERKATESGEPVEGQEVPDADAISKARVAELRIATEEFKFELAQQKGAIELAALQAKHNQNLAINDQKAAMQVMEKLQYPRSDAAQRR